MLGYQRTALCQMYTQWQIHANMLDQVNYRFKIITECILLVSVENKPLSKSTTDKRETSTKLGTAGTNTPQTAVLHCTLRMYWQEAIYTTPKSDSVDYSDHRVPCLATVQMSHLEMLASGTIWSPPLPKHATQMLGYALLVSSGNIRLDIESGSYLAV